MSDLTPEQVIREALCDGEGPECGQMRGCLGCGDKATAVLAALRAAGYSITRGGWECVDIWGDEEVGPIAVHVIPTYEDHDATPDCWCVPREDDGVWTHRDKLERVGPADPEGAR